MKYLFSLLLVSAAVLFSLPSCSHKESLRPYGSKTFVLVHGAWQAPWVWDVVKSQLEAAGQKVVIVQLPGHGSDTTSPVTLTLDKYRDVVIKAINDLNHDAPEKDDNVKATTGQKVILVGHSLAGMVISEVAEAIPGQIEKLVYIGAYLPANGQSLLDLANTDAQSLLGKALVFHPATLGVPPDSIANIFCQDGSTEVKQLLVGRYRDEPLIPFTNQVSLTAGNFGRTDKYYIHTLLDHVVGPDLQNRMIATTQITASKVYPINTSHSPFLSHPDKVTEILLKITR